MYRYRILYTYCSVGSASSKKIRIFHLANKNWIRIRNPGKNLILVAKTIILNFLTDFFN